MAEEAKREPVTGRALAIGGVIVLTFAIGRYGLRPLAEGVAAPPRAPDETRLTAARDIPRPPRSELFASGDAAGDPHRVLLRYTSQAGVAEVADFYRREMPSRGWRPMDVQAAQAGYPGAILGFSTLAGSWCMITISRMAEGGVGVTILKMRGAPPRPRAPERPAKEEST